MSIIENIYKLEIPKIVETNVKGYEFIASVFIAISTQQLRRVLIDFEDCIRFDGNLASALGAILDKLVSNGYEIWLTSPKSEKVRKILSMNHFLRAWKIETQIEDKEDFIPYSRFEKEDSNSFKDYIDGQLMKKKRFPIHTALAGEKIVESIFEIYANAIMHGDTKYVYSCGEYQESNHILNMTIVDCGITICENVNSFKKIKGLNCLNDVEAIIWAFEEGNTTKPETGGLGLALLKEFIKQNNGALQVVSSRGMVSIQSDKMEQNLLRTSFPGTIVNMRFNFNDKKHYYLLNEIGRNNLL